MWCCFSLQQSALFCTVLNFPGNISWINCRKDDCIFVSCFCIFVSCFCIFVSCFVGPHKFSWNSPVAGQLATTCASLFLTEKYILIADLHKVWNPLLVKALRRIQNHGIAGVCLWCACVCACGVRVCGGGVIFLIHCVKVPQKFFQSSNQRCPQRSAIRHQIKEEPISK